MIVIALKKLCRCGRLIDYGEKYCGECSKTVDIDKKQRHKDYKDRRTDKREQVFYNSKEWIVTRDIVKRKYKGLCLYSYYILGEIVYTDYIHHIIELKEDWDKRLDIENLIPCCASVHQMIHKKYLNSDKDKKQMQELLFRLIERWEKEFEGLAD